MVSCYTANLAAFLTVNKIENTVNSVDDLLSQNEIYYGTVLGSTSFDIIKVAILNNTIASLIEDFQFCSKVIELTFFHEMPPFLELALVICNIKLVNF